MKQKHREQMAEMTYDVILSSHKKSSTEIRWWAMMLVWTFRTMQKRNRHTYQYFAKTGKK